MNYLVHLCTTPLNTTALGLRANEVPMGLLGSLDSAMPIL